MQMVGVGEFKHVDVVNTAAKVYNDTHASPCWLHHHPTRPVSADPISPLSPMRLESPMSFHPNQSHGGPAAAPPNMAQNFNAMLQRSAQEPGQLETVGDVPGRPSSSIGGLLGLIYAQGRNADSWMQAMGVYTVPHHRRNMGQTSSVAQEGHLRNKYCPSICHHKLS